MMTSRLLSCTVRNIFHSRLQLSSPMTCSALVNRQSSCLPAWKPFQLLENSVSVKSFHCRLLHTTTTIRNWQENKNQHSIAQLPCLMNNPPHIVWPNFFKSISSMMQSALIIKPYFDNDFNLKEFARGAKHALFTIANAISVGDLESVKELLDKDSYTEINENINRYNSNQLAQFALSNPEDVYLTFPYQVGIIMNEIKGGVQERFVEITVCYHIFRGLNELVKKGDFQPGPSSFQTHRDKIVICNYRFIREFTKGVEGQWTVNMVHHFNLSDDS